MNMNGGNSDFIMLTDWEAKQHGIMIKVESLETILVETDCQTGKTRITAWLRYIDSPLELYNGTRVERFYPRLLKHVAKIKGDEFITINDIGINNVKLSLDVEYLQSLTVEKDSHIDGGDFPGGRIFAHVQYREATNPIILYEGDMRICYRIYHSIAETLDKMASINLIQIHGGKDENESILHR